MVSKSLSTHALSQLLLKNVEIDLNCVSIIKYASNVVRNDKEIYQLWP